MGTVRLEICLEMEHASGKVILVHFNFCKIVSVMLSSLAAVRIRLSNSPRVSSRLRRMQRI